MAVLQVGYPLQSKELAKELAKRSKRSGAPKKHAVVAAKFKAMKKRRLATKASSPRTKKMAIK